MNDKNDGAAKASSTEAVQGAIESLIAEFHNGTAEKDWKAWGRDVVAHLVGRASIAATVEQPDLHARIMNIACRVPGEFADKRDQHAYKIGHRDARHAAAELCATQTHEAQQEKK